MARSGGDVSLCTDWPERIPFAPATAGRPLVRASCACWAEATGRKLAAARASSSNNRPVPTAAHCRICFVNGFLCIITILPGNGTVGSHQWDSRICGRQEPNLAAFRREGVIRTQQTPSRVMDRSASQQDPWRGEQRTGSGLTSLLGVTALPGQPGLAGEANRSRVAQPASGPVTAACRAHKQTEGDRNRRRGTPV